MIGPCPWNDVEPEDLGPRAKILLEDIQAGDRHEATGVRQKNGELLGLPEQGAPGIEMAVPPCGLGRLCHGGRWTSDV